MRNLPVFCLVRLSIGMGDSMTKEKISLSIILIVVCLIATGCGKESPAPDAGGQKDVDERPQLHWHVSHSPLSEQYEGATMADGKIYAYRYVEGGADVSVFAADTVEQTASYGIPDVTEVMSISASDSGQICLWGSTENGNALWQVSPDGDIRTLEDIEVEDLGLYAELKNFYADSNGLYYIWYTMHVPCAEVYEDGEENVYTALDRIYVKDQQMNTILYEQVPDSYSNRLLSMAFDEEGIPVMLAKDRDGYYVQRMRTAVGEEYEPRRLEMGESVDLERSGRFAHTKEGLLYVQEGALYLYHLSDFRNEKLLELAGVGIQEEDIIYLGMDGSTIEVIDNYRGLGHSEYSVIAEGESPKTQLTLGVTMLQPEMRRVIASFNRYQDEVTIEPIVYVEGWDYDAGYGKLMLDVIQGKAPDLIAIYDENLARNGTYSDLYAFMQEDAEMKKEDFVSNVLRVYEVNGRLHTIAPSFLVHTMWGAGSTVNGRKGIDAAEMMRLLQSKGGDVNSIDGFSADENVLTTLCGLNMDQFIDWSEGTCDFTGNEFQQIIDFTKEYEGKPYESLYRALRNGDVLLTLGVVTSVEDYRLASELYGENVQFIGYPTGRGNGSAAQFIGDLTINSKSEHQKEAWEFVKYYVQNGYGGTGFPIVQERFDAVLEESLHETMVPDEGGKSSKVAKTGYTERDVISIHVFKCEPEDVEAIRALVNDVSDKFQYHTEIQKIIDEEVPFYFNGQKGIEEVCKTIQNRVQLYLDEK